MKHLSFTYNATPPGTPPDYRRRTLCGIEPTPPGESEEVAPDVHPLPPECPGCRARHDVLCSFRAAIGSLTWGLWQRIAHDAP